MENQESVSLSRILLWMEHISCKWVLSWINLGYLFKLKGVDVVNVLFLNSIVVATTCSLFTWIFRNLSKFQRTIISLGKTKDYKSLCYQRREFKYFKNRNARNNQHLLKRIALSLSVVEKAGCERNNRAHLELGEVASSSVPTSWCCITRYVRTSVSPATKRR